MTAPPRTLVIVPTYDEAETIAEVLRRLRSGAADVDVLVVDDSSPDGTGRIAEDVAGRDAAVHVLHRPGKQGLGSAYRIGFAWGMGRGYDLFATMDADLSHDPDMLPDLVAAAAQADVVVGSRYVPGGATSNWSRGRRALSRGGNRYVRLVTGVPVSDATSGFRVYRREVLEEIDVPSLRSEGYSFQLETVLRSWRQGFAVREVPITFVERRAGRSKISRAIVLEAMWRVLVWGARARRTGPRHPSSVGREPEVG